MSRVSIGRYHDDIGTISYIIYEQSSMGSDSSVRVGWKVGYPPNPASVT